MRIVGWVALGAGLLLGCGSGSEPDPTSPSSDEARASNDESFYRASATTRAELGVSTWSTPIDDRGGVIKGRDSARAVLIELQRSVTKTADQSMVQYVLRQGEQTFMLKMLLERDGVDIVGVKTIENTFASTPAARRVLELLESDIKAGSISTPRTSTGKATQALSLRPQDLTDGKEPSLVGCVEKQYSTCPVLDDGSVTETVAPCADLIEFYNSWTAQTANTCSLCDQTGNATQCQVCANFEKISEQQLAAVNKCTAENPAQCCPTGELVEDEGSSGDACSPPAECWETCGCSYGE